MGARSRLVKTNEPRAKKRFGQHFLRDTGIINRIVRWIAPGSADLFVEIGAGSGALSAQLAPRVARLLAVEVDPDCIPVLEETLAAHKSARVISADILHLDITKLISEYVEPDREIRVAGNLPYNIATAILDLLLHSGLPIKDMHFMFQLEVAQRITAAPGSRRFGYLSVDCQHHCDVRMGFKVSPACFAPRPQVSSATVSFRPRPLRESNAAIERHFEMLTKAAFSYRRKKLANSLGKNPVYGKISGELLNRARIDGSRRPEELSVQDYENLAKTCRDLFDPPRTDRTPSR